ncbi:lysozyme inhibitor LprI family protein [Bradyrhizobium sp. SRS-191]|uniref:lysozyme inhibitor LprI family protein n=1 Tax=Bradyrhizobium sp. SRS-191 TaxID=2962606 RepID=UPI00211DA6B2|nr:lysozyme inhibitor LprI family protein [Bradyrhizobium sp. SRS-191]
MKVAAYVPLLVAGLALAPEARALDCTKAQQPVDKIICASPQLKKADEAMSAAYFKLLRETTDPEFHEALIRSQRRWLKVRSGGVDRFGAAESDPEAQQSDARILLDRTRHRTDELQGGALIRAMERQRKIVAKDSGGAFAGYEPASCFFSPPPYGNWNYLCLSSMYRQHQDRICSVSLEWASGHISEVRSLDVVKDGRASPKASCAIRDFVGDDKCPEPDDDVDVKAIAHWTTASPGAAAAPAPAREQRWTYDPDVDARLEDQPWMEDCLFAPVFPPPAQTRSAPAAKP